MKASSSLLQQFSITLFVVAAHVSLSSSFENACRQFLHWNSNNSRCVFIWRATLDFSENHFLQTSQPQILKRKLHNAFPPIQNFEIKSKSEIWKRISMKYDSKIAWYTQTSRQLSTRLSYAYLHNPQRYSYSAVSRLYCKAWIQNHTHTHTPRKHTKQIDL